jgi:hypothetical protein
LVRGFTVLREYRVSAGPFGGAAEVLVLLDQGAVCVEIVLASGARHTRQLRRVADGNAYHLRTNEYLERCWVVRDIVRAVADITGRALHDHG